MPHATNQQADDLTPEQQANWEAHKKRMERFSELNKMTKARLCQMYRDLGHMWSLHPLEKWRKDEIITGIIEIEQSRAARAAETADSLPGTDQ